MVVSNNEVARRPTTVSKLVDPTVDLGNLLLIDHDPFDDETSHSSEELLRRARDNVQYLFNQIWELDKQRVDEAVVVTLPEKTYRLPREKPIPEPRPMTKWEKFAQTKGIVKQKKAKKVYDEASGDWKPTWGYHRGNDETKDWLIEIPENKDPNVDYFEERKKVKKERIAKNEMQRLKNVARHVDAIGKKNKAPPVEPTSLGVGVDPTERNKSELRLAADRAKVATASVGKFQEKLKLEKPNVKKGIKRKFESNIGSISSEKERNKGILERLSAKKAKLNEAVLPSIAGNVEPSEAKKTKEPPRMKSKIHRQQHFQKSLKDRKKNRGAGAKGPNGKKERTSK